MLFHWDLSIEGGKFISKWHWCMKLASKCPQPNTTFTFSVSVLQKPPFIWIYCHWFCQFCAPKCVPLYYNVSHQPRTKKRELISTNKYTCSGTLSSNPTHIITLSLQQVKAEIVYAQKTDMFTYNSSNVDAVLSCVKNSLLIVTICWQMWRMNAGGWENPQCLEVLFKGENAACMKVFQARLKLWNIELSWFDTSAGETSINNRRSWIFRNCMLWLTCNLKKVQYTNDAVMIAQHQGWTRARHVSVCMCCFWTEGHMTALSRNLNNLDDVSPLCIDNYCQIRKVLFSTHSGFSAFIPVYFLFQIATITVLEVSFDFTISPSLCPGVHLSCLYILNSEHLKHLNINTS